MNINIEKKGVKNRELTFITVKNSKDFEIVFTDCGASIYSIAYPNKEGVMGRVTEACKDLERYMTFYYGKTVAPVAGRMQNATATLNGETFNFVANETVNCLHSGPADVGMKTWNYEVKVGATKAEVIFTIKGKHLEGGFPANIAYKITYIIYDNKKEVTIKFYAKPDRPAFINMTNHIYFNMNGGKDKIVDHELWLSSSKVADMDQGLIIQKFVDVPHYLDFQSPTRLGKNIFHPNLMNHRSGGMDHPFLLDHRDYTKPCASLYDPKTKRKMTMYTTYPSVICYCDNASLGIENLAGVVTDHNYGITFESVYPTHIPQNIVFTPEHPFSEKTKYKFN